MIFNRFRTPKYQDPRADVRLAAIDKLEPGNQEHKGILHELAFNDDNANVSLKALTRLNSFPLWSKMAEIAKDERVQKRARLYVEQVIFDDDSHFSEQEKLTFLRECNQNSYLEKAFDLDWLLNNHVNDALGMLERLDKPHFTRKVLLGCKAEALQLALLEYEYDTATLQKLVKKTHHSSVAEAAQAKLDYAAFQQQRSVELNRQVTLVLSQLRALKDINNFDRFTQQRAALEQAYQSARHEFITLTGRDEHDFANKYKNISASLDEYQQVKLKHWQAEQRAEQQQQRVERLLDGIANLDKQRDALTTACVNRASVNDADINGVIVAYDALSSELQACTRLSGLSDSVHRALENNIQYVRQQQTALQTLPEVAQSVQQGRDTLAALKALHIPESPGAGMDDVLDTMHELNMRFKASQSKVGRVWPEALEQEWRTTWSALKSAETNIKRMLNEKLDKCRAKLRVVDSLVKQGKYNAAMALFTRVSQWFEVLPVRQQNHIQRAFNNTAEQVASLKGWQAYIAAPRKPGLLQQAEALNSATDQIASRAQEVKRLRAEWQSLGDLGTAEDNQLNTAFERALEVAFEPCRRHYADEQAARAENLQHKRQLIDEITALQSNKMDVTELPRAFNKLQQRWRTIGHVDYQQLEGLQEAHRKAVLPIERKIAAFYQDNAEQKSTLLSKLHAAADEDDVRQAAEEAKQLQKQWKAIGHAGKKAEAQLWGEFRKLNDQIFANLNASRQADKDQTREQLDDILNQAKLLSARLKRASSQAEVSEIRTQMHTLEHTASSLVQPGPLKIKKVLSDLERELYRVSVNMQQAKRDEQMSTLFEVMKSWRDADLPQGHDTLPRAWQQAFTGNSQCAYNRQDITLRMEIVAGLESPSAEQTMRNQVRLTMMADKLQDGAKDDLDSLLRDWIAHGPLSEQDMSLLERVSNVFSQHP